MITSIAKLRNGHAVPLSKKIMQQVNFRDNDKIAITIKGNAVILKKASLTKAEEFDWAFKNYEGDWHCSEFNTVKDVGNEVIK